MRSSSLYLFLTLICSSCISSPSKVIDMNTPKIKTSIGEIAYYIKEVKGTEPIVFLHGVYYDHHLWNYQRSRITDRSTIAIDMPLHGQSKGITKKNWDLQDCAQMLIEILDSLEIEKCYAIGHSWGSMTILRAASQHPDRFIGLGFCNMPLAEGSLGAKLQFGFQHSLLPFRKFYTKQVAKAMFDKESFSRRPEMVEYLEAAMGQLSNKDIRQTDKAVISHVESAYPYLENLQVPALAIKGKDDYVPTAKNITTTVVDGKHTSPLEQPEEVMQWIRRLVGKSKKSVEKGG